MNGRLPILLVLLPLLVIGGCGFNPPQPWEKASLAAPEMQFDFMRAERRYDQHFYFSKEASSGGDGFSGGGCGCN